jgi:Flp pilus assembly protein TadD
MILSRTNRVQIEQDNLCPLGLTLCRDGQIERGADELRKALALNPEDRDAAKALEMIRAR